MPFWKKNGDTVTRPTREEIVAAYKALLGREPEKEAITIHMRAEGLEALLRDIRDSQEFMIRVKNNPLFYYNSNFDAMATVCRHAKANTTPHPSYVTNYLGVRVDPAVCPSLLQGRGGEIEPIPVPSNWHADIAEFAAVLRAVELARDTFTMAELGCGWGCWMNNAGTVAKRRGLKVFLMGVEGDQGHIALAKKSLATNGFSPAEVQIFWV